MFTNTLTPGGEKRSRLIGPRTFSPKFAYLHSQLQYRVKIERDSTSQCECTIKLN